MSFSTAPQFATTSGRTRLDPRLLDILRTAANSYGLDVQAFSGVAGRSTGTTNHPGGYAVDIKLIDPSTGKALPDYQSAASFPAYEKFAQTARVVQQQKYPELDNTFRWGGYFGGGPNPMDLMHFDINPSLNGAMGAGSWNGGLSSTYAKQWGVTGANPGLGTAAGKQLVADIQGGPLAAINAATGAPLPMPSSSTALAYANSSPMSALYGAPPAPLTPPPAGPRAPDGSSGMPSAPFFAGLNTWGPQPADNEAGYVTRAPGADAFYYNGAMVPFSASEGDMSRLPLRQPSPTLGDVLDPQTAALLGPARSTATTSTTAYPGDLSFGGVSAPPLPVPRPAVPVSTAPIPPLPVPRPDPPTQVASLAPIPMPSRPASLNSAPSVAAPAATSARLVRLPSGKMIAPGTYDSPSNDGSVVVIADDGKGNAVVRNVDPGLAGGIGAGTVAGGAAKGIVTSKLTDAARAALDEASKIKITPPTAPSISSSDVTNGLKIMAPLFGGPIDLGGIFGNVKAAPSVPAPPASIGSQYPGDLSLGGRSAKSTPYPGDMSQGGVSAPAYPGDLSSGGTPAPVATPVPRAPAAPTTLPSFMPAGSTWGTPYNAVPPPAHVIPATPKPFMPGTPPGTDLALSPTVLPPVPLPNPSWLAPVMPQSSVIIPNIVTKAIGATKPGLLDAARYLSGGGNNYSYLAPTAARAGVAPSTLHAALMAQQNRSQGGPVGSPSNFNSSYFESAIG